MNRLQHLNWIVEHLIQRKVSFISVAHKVFSSCCIFGFWFCLRDSICGFAVRCGKGEMIRTKQPEEMLSEMYRYSLPSRSFEASLLTIFSFGITHDPDQTLEQSIRGNRANHWAFLCVHRRRSRATSVCAHRYCSQFDAWQLHLPASQSPLRRRTECARDAELGRICRSPRDALAGWQMDGSEAS